MRKVQKIELKEMKFLSDAMLSWKAKGIMMYLVVLDPKDKINITHLKNLSSNGRDSTSKGIQELIDGGYIKKEVIRDDRARYVETYYMVKEVL